MIRIPEIEELINGAKLFCKNECENPTGTFKDREASYVISKAKEFGIKKIVFHSTGNTGRAYANYAKKANIESFFFLPLNCIDKCDSSLISDNIHIIAIDGPFNQVSKIAKTFAKKNGIPHLAPLHDKLEGKATIAYEQFEELPEATMFVQTIAGGYGIMGFSLGYDRLSKFEINNKKYKVPRIIAVQTEDNCTIEKGIRIGKDNLLESDLILPLDPFEKTLQSTNPLSTFAKVKNCLDKTNGLIVTASLSEIDKLKVLFDRVLHSHDIQISFDNEKSPYISFTGLVKIAREGKINSKDIIYMIITGKGCNNNILTPRLEAILKPSNDGYVVNLASQYLKNLL